MEQNTNGQVTQRPAAEVIEEEIAAQSVVASRAVAGLIALCQQLATMVVDLGTERDTMAKASVSAAVVPEIVE